jgi:hypothetical protein
VKNQRLGTSVLCAVLVSFPLFGAVQQAEAACIPPPAGIVAWWPGDGNSKDIVAAKNGTATAVTFPTSKVGRGFGFTGGYGIVQGVKIGKTPLLNLKSAMTIEAWIKPGASSIQGPILEYVQTNPAFSGTPFGVHFWQGSDGYSSDMLYINVRSTDGAYHQANVHALTPGVWQHVAMTYDKCSGDAYLYVNGTQYGPYYLGIFDMMTDDALYIGYRPNTPGDSWYSWNGGIDEISMYGRALSAEEIAAIYMAGASGKCKN